MLKIYGVPISVHTRKAIVAAIAKALPYEVVPVVPVIPDNPPPDWRQLSPTGLIPALADGDFVVADSAAICAYMERLNPKPSLYPQAPRDYARALALEQYGGTVFREIVRPLFHEVFVHPKIHGTPTDNAKIDAVRKQAVPEIFGYLEDQPDEAYLVGPSLSIADIAIASNLITYRYIGFDLDRKRFPRLTAWFECVVREAPLSEALRRERSTVDSMGLDRTFVDDAALA
jgi:glutathione S-transferase